MSTQPIVSDRVVLVATPEGDAAAFMAVRAGDAARLATSRHGTVLPWKVLGVPGLEAQSAQMLMQMPATYQGGPDGGGGWVTLMIGVAADGRWRQWMPAFIGIPEPPVPFTDFSTGDDWPDDQVSPEHEDWPDDETGAS